MSEIKRALHAEQLFTGRKWLRRARLEIDLDGNVIGVTGDAPPDGCERIRGTIVPGVPNLHSHAHQRAMAGLAERSGEGDDSFWTWREVMYQHLGRFGPDQLEAVAAQLYVEMLEAGFTAVAEFQYLHHDPNGEPYEQRAEMSLRCLAAARATGIGLTSLPVLYAHGGFGGEPPTAGQKRFVNSVPELLTIAASLEVEADDQHAVGLAPHSLRAVTPEELREAAEAYRGRGPVHIHVAEQLKEVEACVAWSGQRPVEWLLDHQEVDEGWCLIHCTHLTDEEVAGLARSGAVAGLCPTTEANLGDGIFRAREYLKAGGRFGIGTDSHISVNPVEDLRWLEYGQRLVHHGRALLAGGAEKSTGRRLLEAALKGGAQACGRPLGHLAPGQRADLLVLDTDHPLLWGKKEDEILDGWIFAGNARLVAQVIVGGETVVDKGRHRHRDRVAARFRRAMDTLRKTA